MHITLNTQSFINAFNEVCPGRFSDEALEVMFEYYEGSEVEFDPVAICCDFSESSIDELIEEYSIDIEEGADEDEKEEAVRYFLNSESGFSTILSSGAVYLTF